MESVPPGYLGIAAAADRVGVTVSTLKRWADEGRLPCLKTRGGHRRFLGTDVELLAPIAGAFRALAAEHRVAAEVRRAGDRERAPLGLG